MSTLPAHLAALQPTGSQPGVRLWQFELGPARNFIYVLLDVASKQAALVDPQTDVDTPLAALEKAGFTLQQVLLTHSHEDHTAGVPELLRRFPDLPVVCHPMDRHRLSKRIERNVHDARDGELVRVGGTDVMVMHTPGHSAGSVCFRTVEAEPLLFTGDTLFIRDCGRTDLETGNTQQMFESLQRLKTLAGNHVVLPGHHYAPACASLLETELLQSMPLKVASVAELQQLP